MTDLTPRQILDAIRDALEETARRFAKDKPEPHGQERRPTATVAKQRTNLDGTGDKIIRGEMEPQPE